MSKPIVILNPSARGERAGNLYEEIRRLAPSVLIQATQGSGDARAFARAAVQDGFDSIIAAGGDGTVNEVVNGIAGSQATLGILPVGTMNVFAKELGLPRSLQACWKIVESGHVREIDLPMANGRAFVQLAGVGLDAQVVQETSREFKKSFGPLSYLISATQIAARKPPCLHLESEGVTHEGSFLLIGNGRFYGGPFPVFTEARIDDGKLDILLFKNLGFLDIIRYLRGIAFGTHTNLSDVAYFRTAHLKVTADGEVPVEVDGEVIGTAPVEFRMNEKRLRVYTRKSDSL